MIQQELSPNALKVLRIIALSLGGSMVLLAFLAGKLGLAGKSYLWALRRWAFEELLMIARPKLRIEI